MIKVHLDLHNITVEGHAPRPEGMEPGQNIVCAAVSALTLTLIEGLEAIAGMRIETVEEPGNVRIRWMTANDTGKALIDTWYIGITRIQNSYPNTITIL